MEPIKYNNKATGRLQYLDAMSDDIGYCRKEVIELLQNGADPNGYPDPMRWPYTSFESAMIYAEIGVMEVMFEKGARITPNTYTAFLAGIYDYGRFIGCDKNVETGEEIPYRNIIVIGRMLLEHGLDPDSPTNRHYNCFTDSQPTFREYLKKKCDKAKQLATLKQEYASLNKEVEDYQHALEKADKVWKIGIKELKDDIALETTVLRIREAKGAQERAPFQQQLKLPNRIGSATLEI